MKTTYKIILTCTALAITGCGDGSPSGAPNNTIDLAAQQGPAVANRATCPAQAMPSMLQLTEAYNRERTKTPGPATQALLTHIAIKIGHQIETLPEEHELDECCIDSRFSTSLYCQETTQ